MGDNSGKHRVTKTQIQESDENGEVVRLNVSANGDIQKNKEYKITKDRI